MSRGNSLLEPQRLRRITFFASLSDEMLRLLASQMHTRRYGRHEVVVTKGSRGDYLMFLLEGRLQAVDYTLEGREIGLNLIYPGNFFGEVALIDNLPRSASVVAILPSEVAFLSRETALKVIFHTPVLAESMLRHFAATIRRLSNYRALLSIPEAPKRLYALLTQLERRRLQNGEEVIENLPTQQQIAIMINTSRETVSRAFADLERQGILRRNARMLIVSQPHQLEMLLSRKGKIVDFTSPISDKNPASNNQD